MQERISKLSQSVKRDKLSDINEESEEKTSEEVESTHYLGLRGSSNSGNQRSQHTSNNSSPKNRSSLHFSMNQHLVKKIDTIRTRQQKEKQKRQSQIQILTRKIEESLNLKKRKSKRLFNNFEKIKAGYKKSLSRQTQESLDKLLTQNLDQKHCF